MKRDRLKFNKKTASWGVLLVSILLIMSSVIATITIREPSGATSGSGMLSTDFIWNSNDKTFVATESGLQAAINDLGNTTGWVDGNMNNVSITSTIELGTGCELRNLILFLNDSSDCTMIKNYDRTNGNDHIKIHHVTLFGNGDGQTSDDSVGSWSDVTEEFSIPFGIYLKHCDYVEIYSCNVTNIQLGGIYIQQGRYGNVHDNLVTKIGDCFDGTNPADCYSAGGIYYYNSTEGTIANNDIIDTYAFGVCVEGYLTTSVNNRCYRTIVSGNYVENTSCGFYCEDAENIKFVDNIAYDLYLKDSSLFGGGFIPCGFYAKSGGKVNRMMYEGNSVEECNTAQSGRGFNVHANNSLLNDNYVYSAHRGIQLGGHNSTIANNVIENVVNAGVWIDAIHYVVINGNIVHTVTNQAMIVNSAADHFIISNNVCDDTIDINAAASSTRICNASHNICTSVVTS